MVINAQGHWPVGANSQALDCQKAATATGLLYSTDGAQIAFDQNGAPTNGLAYPISSDDVTNSSQQHSNYITAYGSGTNQLIPPGPTLQKGKIAICEPIKWLPMYRKGGVVAQYNALTNADHTAGSPCAFMVGNRAMYGFLKFSLHFSYVCAADNDVPITTRMTVLKMNGKLIDDMGDIRNDFSLLKPFPVSTRKYQKLFDKTFTLQRNQTKQIAQTIGLNTWLQRPAGIPNEAPPSQAVNNGNVVKHLADADFLGGDLPVPSPMVTEMTTRIEPWKEVSLSADGPAGAGQIPAWDDQAELNTTYNMETSRIVILLQSSDDAVGGFAGVPASVAANAAASPMVSCCGYIRAVAYDDQYDA